MPKVCQRYSVLESVLGLFIKSWIRWHTKIMFENYFRKLGARQYHRTRKYDVALEYFFDFSLHLLEELGTRPDWCKDFFMLSDEETLNYRNYWVAKRGITQGSFGIM